jgi:hypothetical protein
MLSRNPDATNLGVEAANTSKVSTSKASKLSSRHACCVASKASTSKVSTSKASKLSSRPACCVARLCSRNAGFVAL